MWFRLQMSMTSRASLARVTLRRCFGSNRSTAKLQKSQRALQTLVMANWRYPGTAVIEDVSKQAPSPPRRGARIGGRPATELAAELAGASAPGAIAGVDSAMSRGLGSGGAIVFAAAT